MEWLIVAAAVLAGLVAGAVLGHARGAAARARAAQQSAAADELRTQLAQLQARLDTESQARAGAEARLPRIDELTVALAERQAALDTVQRDHAGARAQIAELETRLAAERKAADEKLGLLEQARVQLGDAFRSLSAEALRSNNESFLKLAEENLQRFQQGAREDLGQRQKAIEQLTQPIRERLERFDGKLDDLEKSRIGAYRALQQQVGDLLEVHLPKLHRETADLVKALRQPHARGRWGEVQLRRVVEMAGMLEHCDFSEQVSQTTDTGRQRPDVIVHLPGGRQIVVDAKAPVDAYLEAVEAQDDAARQTALLRHARQVKDHIGALGRKAYFEQFEPTPEFVVLFVPGEAFFSAALAAEPTLIEYGAESRVIPASPTTLIALLKAVAYGWRQEAMAQNAVEVAALGRELYDRIGILAGHWATVGKRLDKAVEAYNSSVGTLESRVLVSARRFRDLRAAAGADLESPLPIDLAPRSLSAAELVDGANGLPGRDAGIGGGGEGEGEAP